ncbi:sensor histidine kinase [Hymenobacter sp. GOD-10R]|uniref:sensor histidine kinase n=1 Tax=Hymenobacter sp. GOD-10R TaxID=3093922 RepID=UPI002D7A2EDE|nr:ATP-binding protein [Hymenobacter sp. GOD-10R]WRQ29001.1 ATP-binding protein [Hymenobacter sp. GOD-10R]
MNRLHLLLLAGLWLLLSPPTAQAQADSAAVVINRLPAEGLPLTKGWRYHAGDDPTWARPDFNDHRWDTITVGRVGQPLPARFLAGPGWFRLRLRLGDSLRQQALGLQTGPALAGFDVYSNGRRIGRYGTYSPDPVQVRTGSPTASPLDLRPSAAGELVLAVRYTPQQHTPWLQAYLAHSSQRNLALRLRELSQIRRKDAAASQADAVFAWLTGIFLLLSLLHLVFYRYNRAQPANRYFAYYALGTGFSCLLLTYWPSVSLEERTVVYGVGVAWLLLAALYSLRALYALFQVRPGWLYKVLGASVLPVVLLMTGEVLRRELTGILCYVGFMIVLTLDQLWLIGRALRQRRRGAGLLGAGFASGIVLLASIALNPFLSSWSPAAVSLIVALSFVLPALGISLFLAREFALDSQLLQVKLDEVERLSAQTLAQEQEKQALLAQQNETLEMQVQQRTGELQRSLTELRATQAQLIQKEKMASLGELTAGIAHEIQNPLNFVNNFADVSAELVAELKEAQAAGDTEEVVALADDLGQNLGKIHQHGQRASSIVRGMLEHSRASTGERQPTDLNTLADEYLRLAYHGLRTKDKGFNAALKTDFAPNLPLVEAVGQDLGRVLLNLFNNAFYAVQKRQQMGEPGYAPTVSVSTRHTSNRVEIRVADNGTGMPPEVQAKIFQPFFTTKPTGEGTGLGLSLSYDIITKGHGGTLAVESQAGYGTEFIITLPI